MAAGENSVMILKVRSSNLDLAAYPQLQDLARFINTMTAQILAEMTGATVEPSSGRSGMAALAEAVADAPANAAAYVLPESGKTGAAIISVPPSFVAAFAESQFGGAFGADETENIPGPIELELLREFIERVRARINTYFRQNGHVAGPDLLSDSEIADSLDGLASRFDSAIFFSIEVVGTVAEGKEQPFAKVFFPMNMLERLGVLELQKKSAAPAETNDEWRPVMERNLLQLDLELGVVIDRYTAMISDLSRLEVGDIIPLSGNAQNALDITLRVNDGEVSLGKARLGVYKNKKAIKLESALSPQ